MSKLFGTKVLERKMCFNELKPFLAEHPKYRLLNLEELDELDGKTYTFYSGDGEVIYNDGIYEYVDAYHNGDVEPTSTMIKLPVVVTYSSEYLEVLACTILDMDSSNIKDFMKFLPKVLQDAPIYCLPNGEASFEPYDNDEQFTVRLKGD